MKDYAKELAKMALKIGAITLSPDNPYTWASGYRMPIYNDNRKHLRYPKNRKLITQAFLELIEKNKIPVDSIAGTSTAGIAPAASLAQELDVPMMIIENTVLYEYPPDYIKSLLSEIDDREYDIVVSTCPSAIIPGVFIANERELPFAYVRAKRKGHGLQQQIEGTLKKGERALLIDYYLRDGYGGKAAMVLEENCVDIRKIITRSILPPAPEPKQKKLVQIEDLISTGGSCITEIGMRREWGDEVDDCLAIFSYDFPETLQKFEDIHCKVHSIFGYDRLLQTALDQKTITPEQHEMLKGWRADPFNWGAKHGFPKVEK